MNNLMFLATCTASESSKACMGLLKTVDENGAEVATGLPGSLALLIHYAYLAIQVAVPIILIIFGMIGFGKAIASQKDDEIKAAQNSFFKKLIIAVVVFLVLSIVHLVFNIASNGSSDNIWTCAKDLLDGNCSS